MNLEQQSKKSLKELARLAALGRVKEREFYAVADIKNIAHDRAEQLLVETRTAIESSESAHGINYRLDFTQKAVTR